MMSSETIFEMNNNNKIIGHYPEVQNSTIKFTGSNNILYCEANVQLVDSKLSFEGSNSVVYLSPSNSPYRLSLFIHSNSVFHIGANFSVNKPITVILSEQKHCFIGDNCMFSYGITFRNSDIHPIYSCSSGTRLNKSKSIYVGDHIWIGQDACILKGTEIDSGCIIGAKSLVAGKKIPNNTSYGGNPCKQIKSGIFWDREIVSNWTSEQTEKSMSYSSLNSDRKSHYGKNFPDDIWIYEYNASECIEWNELENTFSSPDLSPMQKCEYLIRLNELKSKNRFVHKHSKQ